MLYDDKPARIAEPGTFRITDGATYTVGHDYVADAVQRVLELSDGDITADIETFGLGLAARRLKCVTFADLAGTTAAICDPRDPCQAELIRDTFSRAKRVGYHNSPFDVPNLFLNELITPADVAKVDDTLIWCRLAEPGKLVPKDLAEVSERYLHIPNINALRLAFKALGLSKTDGFEQFDLDRPIYLMGAAQDPLLTGRVYPLVKKAAYARLTTGHPFSDMMVTGSDAWTLIEREQIINRVLLLRACKGFLVDFEYLDRYKEQNNEALVQAEKELRELGIDPGNGQHLLSYLDGLGAVPPDHPRTPTGLLKADQKAIENIVHPVARMFARHKAIAKVPKDYLEKVVTLADSNGRIHPVTKMLQADTGRAAMSDPPVHQFPEAARGIICADPGDSLTSLDFGQIEPITIATWAQDTDVLDAYASGVSDVYTALGTNSGMLPPGTTSAMCEKVEFGGLPGYKKIRSTLKTTLLAQLFGEGLPKLSADLGLDPGPFLPPSQWEVDVRGFDPEALYPQYHEGKKLKEAVFTAMPKTKEKIELLKSVANRYRKIITISGRVLDIPRSSYGGQFRVAAHKGVNYWCQGSAYDILADALLRIIQAGLGDALYFTMHDELIVSTDAARDIRKIMETPPDALIRWAGGRMPVLRTDMALLGERWSDA